MMKFPAWLIALAAISVFGSVAVGAPGQQATQAPVAAEPPPTPEIISECTNCHGETGVSDVRYVPHLAGQRRGYLRKQLNAFRDNTRTNPGMHAVVMPLDEALIDDIAAYFWAQGQQSKAAKPEGGVSPDSLDPKLAKLVEKCDRCHEPNEFNQKAIQDYPVLAGQRQEYLAHEMRDFQNKHKRDNEMMYAMTDVLIGEEIDKLASFYENRRSPQRLGAR